MRKAGVITLSLAAVAAAALLVIQAPFATPARAEYVDIKFGPRLLKAEVAATPRTRQVGLMNRMNLPENQGMLFVFPADATQCMWMKNTLIPLSVAFIDAQGRIVNIADMQPGSLQTHCSAGTVRYALEVNQGWFRRRAIQPGEVAAGLAHLKSQ